MTTATMHTTHHQFHFPTGIVAVLILLLVGAAIVFAVVEGLPSTTSVEVPYAPYTAGPVIHTGRRCRRVWELAPPVTVHHTDWHRRFRLRKVTSS